MNTDQAYYRLAFKIFADFSGTIAVPAVLGALIGKRLDELHQSSPKYLILCLLIALALTAVIVVKKAKVYQKEYDLLNKK